MRRQSQVFLRSCCAYECSHECWRDSWCWCINLAPSMWWRRNNPAGHLPLQYRAQHCRHPTKASMSCGKKGQCLQNSDIKMLRKIEYFTCSHVVADMDNASMEYASMAESTHHDIFILLLSRRGRCQVNTTPCDFLVYSWDQSRVDSVVMTSV